MSADPIGPMTGGAGEGGGEGVMERRRPARVTAARGGEWGEGEKEWDGANQGGWVV